MPRLICSDGSTYEIERRRTTLGRINTSDIVLDDSLVSRQHAQIIFEGIDFILIDNLSLNGTLVNGQKIDERRLNDGDRIQIGARVFVFESHTISPKFMPGEGDTIYHLSRTLEEFVKQGGPKGIGGAPKDEDSLKAGHRNLQVLHNLAKSMGTTLIAGKLLDDAARIIMEAFIAQLVSISLIEGDEGKLVPKTVITDKGDDAPYPYLKSVGDKVIMGKAGIVAYNPPGETGGTNVGSAMAAPLWVRDDISGLVYAENAPRSRSYSEEDLDLLIALANMIASALENANLYARLQKSMNALKDQQSQLIQTEKLAGIGILAAGVAHEINNPLAGVMGMAEAILEEDDPENIKQYAKDILDYSGEAAEIVRELSSYSRVSKDDSLEPANLNQVIEDALKLARHNKLFKNIEVKTEFGDITYCMANANELKQVFLNLTINSIQAMKGEGALYFNTWMEGSNVVAKVKDTGPGIPEENLDKIYDPFYTTKEAGAGTGLGLNIAYRIVTKYRGTIDVESKEGIGTIFTITFPAGKGGKNNVKGRV